MVFYAEFGGREHRIASDGATQGPITETVLAYAVAFVVSAAMLAMFGRVDALNGAATARVVTLAFPVSIGAALGRLLIDRAAIIWRPRHQAGADAVRVGAPGGLACRHPGCGGWAGGERARGT
jgi:hypothetical protein